MKVFVVVTEDHHTDVDIEVFLTKEAAIARAWAIARASAGDIKDIEERDIKGWPSEYVFSLDYSLYPDHVTVIEKTLDEQSGEDDKIVVPEPEKRFQMYRRYLYSKTFIR